MGQTMDAVSPFALRTLCIFAVRAWVVYSVRPVKARPSCRVRLGTKREYTVNNICVLACPIRRAIHSGFSPEASIKVAVVCRVW